MSLANRGNMPDYDSFSDLLSVYRKAIDHLKLIFLSLCRHTACSLFEFLKFGNFEVSPMQLTLYMLGNFSSCCCQ